MGELPDVGFAAHVQEHGAIQVPDWVSKIADDGAEEVSHGCPVGEAIERAIMVALAEVSEQYAVLPLPATELNEDGDPSVNTAGMLVVGCVDNDGEQPYPYVALPTGELTADDSDDLAAALVACSRAARAMAQQDEQNGPEVTG